MANGALAIGKLFGIDIELNWLFILFTLFLYLLNPLSALVWILLFICVLLHELSHSTTAKRNGIGISKIILLPFGGISVMEETKVPPRIAFNIAIVGPLTNLFLGGIFGIITIFTPNGLLLYLIQELFIINLLLGISNVIPAYPLDGARVLSSYFERTHSKFESTMLTAKASKVCMALIILGSVVYFLLNQTYSNEFLLIIDIFIVYFFIYPATNAEESFARIGKETVGMTVNDVLTEDYTLIRSSASIQELFRLIKSSKKHTILTKMPDGKYYLVDVFGKAASNGAKSVQDLVVPIPNVQVNSKLSDNILKIEANEYKLAAVLKGKMLAGIATSRHISALISISTAGRNKSKALNN